MSKKGKSRPNSDSTKYGEIIPSMFSWISPSDQKKRADELNEMTKGKKTNQENEFSWFGIVMELINGLKS